MKNSYGFDILSRDMLILGVILGIIALGFFGTVGGLILCFASTLVVAVTLYRTLSSDIEKRSSELCGYEKVSSSVRDFFKRIFARSKNNLRSHKNYKYFHCPNCKQRLRVPKGKGKIRVTCAKCGTQFEKRT